MRTCLRALTIAIALFAQFAAAPAVAGDTIQVGSNGQPSYSVAIDTPPGVHNLLPSLALQYSAAQVNGSIGWEWSLSGTELITRCPSILSVDGTRGPITFRGSDHLCLNGTRLIQTDSAGNPNGAGGDALGSAPGQVLEFRTEVDPYERIRSYGYADGANASSGPAYFKVWTKDGAIKEFGAGPNGIAVSANALIFSAHSTANNPIGYGQLWALSHVADLWGNGIDFKYAQRTRQFGSQATLSGGLEWELTEIQYANNKIIFNYADRPLASNNSLLDASESFTQGSRLQYVKLLTSIQEVTNSPNTTSLGAAPGSIPVRNIQLSYLNSAVTNHSLLRAVKVCAGADTSACMPATSFTYSQGGGLNYVPNAAFDADPLSAVVLAPSMYGANTPTNGAIIGDFNGDGKSDILVADSTNSTSSLYLSNGDGSFRKVPTGAGAGQYAGYQLSYKDACITPIVADFNGDGLPDIAVTTVRSRYCQNTEGHPVTQHLYMNNGDGSFTEVAGGFRFGDFVPGPAVVDTGTLPATWSQGWVYYLLDVNGDGILDVVTSFLPSSAFPNSCSTYTCTQVFIGDGKGGFTEQATNIASYSVVGVPYLAAQTGSQEADLDGDGLLDLVAMPDPVMHVPSSIAAARSRGDGNFDIITTDFCNGSLFDYNGDGVVDCLFRGYTGDQYYPSTTNALYVHDNIGASPSQVTNLNYPTLLAGPGVVINLADYNGDGKGDILRIASTRSSPGSPAATSTLYLSNGDGTFSNASSSWPLTTFNFDNYFQGDFTGHGNVEILTVCVGDYACPQIPNGRLSRLWTKTDPQPADMLMTVTSDSGRTSSLQYFDLGNPTFSTNTLGPRYASDLKVPGLAATLPTVDSHPAGWVVGALTVDSGVGSGIQRTDYSYKGAKFDLKDNRALGFREMLQQTTGADGTLLTKDTTFLQSLPYIGRVSNETLFKAALNQVANAPVLKKTTNVYCDATASSATVSSALTSGTSCPQQGPISRVYELTSTTTANDLDGTALPSVNEQVSGFTLDGEVSSITTTRSGATGTHTTVNNRVFVPDDTSCTAPDTCNWFLGRPDTNTINASTTETLLSTSPGNYAQASATSGSGSTQVGGLTPSLNFGTLTTGTSRVLTAVLGNDGGSPLALNGMPSIAGAGMSITQNTCGTSVPVGGSCAISVTFAPTAAGAVSGTLTVPTAGGSLTTALSGTGVAPPSTSSTSFSAAVATVGTADTLSVTVSNAVSWATNCTGAASFSQSGNGTLQPTSLTEPITPTSAGTVTCTTTATNAAGATATSTASFQAVVAPAVTSVTFGAASVTAGTPDTLSWATSGATSVSVNCSGSGSYAYSGASVNNTGASVVTGSAGTATCSVTASNAAGATAARSGSFQVVAPASITANSFSAAAITTGGTDTLTLTVANAATYAVSCTGATTYSTSGNGVSFGGVLQPTTATIPISSSSAGTVSCTSTATNPLGAAVSASSSFQVVAAPTVNSVTFGAANVTSGNSNTLNWSTSGATNVAVTCNGQGAYSYSGSTVNYTGAGVSTSGTGTSTCRVTATNAAGSAATGSNTFQVVAPATVSSVTFGASTVTAGSNNTLNWATTNATNVSVSCTGAGSYSYAGTTVNYTGATVSTSATGTGTCTVTASNAAGTSTSSSSSFQVIAAPSVSAVTFSAATATTGGTDTMYATVSNATNYAVSCTGSTSYSTSGSALVSGGVPQPTSLTIPLTPSGTGATTCTVTGTNAVGSSATANGTFQVVAAPVVNSVSFSSGYVTTGSYDSVNWATSNATSVSVSCSGTASYSYSGTAVNNSGVSLVGTSGTGTGTCSVTAYNAAGATAAGSNTFQVVAAPSVTSASFNPSSVPANTASTFGWATANATSASVSCSGAGATATGSGTSGSISVGTSSQGSATCTVTASNAAGTTTTGSGSLTVTAPIPVAFTSSGYYTFTNPNAFPVTLSAVGAVGTGTSFSATNSTCNTTSAVAAGASCTVSFSVSKPTCGGNSGNAFVTDAGGSTSGATLYAASGKICP